MSNLRLNAPAQITKYSPNNVDIGLFSPLSYNANLSTGHPT